MSARAWRRRHRNRHRVRAALRTVWRRSPQVRAVYPVKADWLAAADTPGTRRTRA